MNLLRIVAVVKGAVDGVDADDAERLLLEDVFFVPHPHVENDIARRAVGLGLEADTEPAVGVVGAFEISGGNGVGENEERRAVTALGGETRVEQFVFVVRA
jgi:hypothetical protein